MAETMKLPGIKKPVPKTYVYAGGAAVAGIVVYAYWSRSSGTSTEDEVLFDEFGNPIAGPSPIATPPTVVDSNIDVDTDPRLPRTNSEWTQMATEFLTNQGYEGSVVVPALGKFIARKPLNSAEQSIVRAAIAAAGYPPEGGPWTVIEDSSPASVGVVPPKNLRQANATSTTITFAWDHVAGATSYLVEIIQGESEVIRTATTSSSVYTAAGLQSDKPYRIGLRAKDGQNRTSDRVTTTGKTKPASGGSTGVLPAPRGIRASGSAAPDINWIWQPVPGAKAYGVEFIAGVNTRIGGGLTPNPSARMRAFKLNRQVQRNSPYRIRIVAINQDNKPGRAANHVARTK